LPLRAERSWQWASLMLFGLLSLAIWVGWAIMMLTDAPPHWAPLARVLPMEFVPDFQLAPTLAAVLATIGGLLALRAWRNQPAKGLTAWVTGLTLSWTLLTTLWMPWLDYAKSYRSVFASMPLPETDCIASINLGEGERAMLHYVTGHNPVRLEVTPGARCATLLVQREAAFGGPAVDHLMWNELWRGSRPGITNERFWLFSLAPRPVSKMAEAARAEKHAARAAGQL
jgi:hypothetical protein